MYLKPRFTNHELNQIRYNFQHGGIIGSVLIWIAAILGVIRKRGAFLIYEALIGCKT